MSNLSLLSAVAAIGMTDPFSDSGIPSRRIYTLTGQTAQAWSRFLDRAAVGGDPYTTTERPGALEAARAFLDSIPVDRLSRARKATVAKLLRQLSNLTESPMSRHANPSGKIVLPFKRGSGPAANVAELLRKAYARRGESISATEAAKRAKGFQQGLLIDGSPLVLERLKRQHADGNPLGWVNGSLVIFDASHYIQTPGFGSYVMTPEGGVVPGDNLLRTLGDFRLQDIRFADPDGTLHNDETRFLGSSLPAHTDSKVSPMSRRPNPAESVRILRAANPSTHPEPEPTRGDTIGEVYENGFGGYEGRAGKFGAYLVSKNRVGQGFKAKLVYSPPGYGHLIPKRLEVEEATKWESLRELKAQLTAAAQRAARAIAAVEGGARTGNPPALIWEFDGEPTSPKALLADNPDNDDVAAAVAYLKKEGAKFSMGRHGTKSVRSWSAVSFGGGAADESVLTVRAAWTEGPVFKAVLDASTIPYAGDLPDADSPFSHRAGSDNYQDDFLSDFEEYEDD